MRYGRLLRIDGKVARDIIAEEVATAMNSATKFPLPTLDELGD